MKNLKDKQHYIDLYDKMTIDDCRWREDFHKNYKHKPSKKIEGINLQAFNKLTWHFDQLYTTLKWYDEKEKTIDEWMERDKKKDELYENAIPPRDVYCLKCDEITELESKHLWDHHDDRDRVLFMFKCNNGCIPMRAFYNDGEEYKIKPHLCPECNSELERESERIENNKIITKEKCSNCEYKNVDKYELSSQEEEKPDPNYERDKERFCLSGQRLLDYQKEREQHEQIAKFVDDMKEKEEHKEDYDAVKSLKKLTIVELENLIKEKTEKEGYMNLRFENPEMNKEVIVPFLINDSKSDRKDRSSSLELQRIIKKSLQDTNWRLMSEGISYRLGILTGRLKAYENEADLLKLVRQNAKD
jgi:hypothetical protein